VGRSSGEYSELDGTVDSARRIRQRRKMFGYLIDYEWDATGDWSYAPVLEMQLNIVLPDGSTEGICIASSHGRACYLGYFNFHQMEKIHNIFTRLARHEINGDQFRQEPQCGLIV
jgi:hypothetical protein